MKAKLILPGKECNHSNCRSTCHVKSNAKAPKPLKRTPLKRSTKPIAKVSEKKKQQNKTNTGGAELWRWFVSQRPKMSGTCANCGSKTSKYSDDYFHFSICHILEKKNLKSLATNDDNWVELCTFGENSCHQQMDNKMISLSDMACWGLIVDKFQAMYPLIPHSERRFIPSILLHYVEIDT